MIWLLIIAGIAFILFMASKGRKTAQEEAIGRLRLQYPKVARLRLVAACPGLDGVLEESDLRPVFDWIMIQMFRRSNTSSLSGLMNWSIKQGEEAATAMTAEVSRQ